MRTADVTVYGLYSSLDGRIRYVGQTVQALSKRLDSHIHPPKHAQRRYTFKWIRSVIAAGHRVVIFPIEHGAVLHEAEKRWIAWYRRRGVILTNHTDGGEGVLGRARTEAERAAISAGNKGKKKSPAHVAKIAAFMRGRKLSEETRLRMSLAHKGKRPANLSALHEAAKLRARERTHGLA